MGGTLAPDVALNASLPSEDDHTLTVAESATHSLGNLIHHSFAPVHWSPEQSTAEFGLPSARAPCMSTSPVVHLRANWRLPRRHSRHCHSQGGARCGAPD